MARFHVPGALFHIMARGIDGMDIFRNDDDRMMFLQLFTANVSKFNYKCLAWCLMPNHYHFLIRASDVPLGKFMRPLNGTYARWYNKKYKRRGYLFQDRFKSVLCQEQQYAQQLIRYIHLNPLRAGLVHSLDELATYEWSGHKYLLSSATAPWATLLQTAETLRRFSDSPDQSTPSYLAYMKEGINELQPEVSGAVSDVERIEIIGSQKGWPAVIGDPLFAQNAMCAHQVEKWRHHRKADYSEVLEAVAKKVCKTFEITKEHLLKRGYLNVRTLARVSFCHIAHFTELIPYKLVADYLGITITPAVKLSLRADVSQT
jgi:REP element-mobilizing transposase RayT